jgi:predicted nucleotidyltransferase
VPTERAAAFLARLVTWLATRADIAGALLVGSQARTAQPADRWSDVDLVVIADEPARYIDDAAWLSELGRPVATFVEPTLLGQRERRVVFETVSMSTSPCCRGTPPTPSSTSRSRPSGPCYDAACAC